jgi:hypothetical protein
VVYFSLLSTPYRIANFWQFVVRALHGVTWC